MLAAESALFCLLKLFLPPNPTETAWQAITGKQVRYKNIDKGRGNSKLPYQVNFQSYDKAQDKARRRK
jgi:hypothetical protein